MHHAQIYTIVQFHCYNIFPIRMHTQYSLQISESNYDTEWTLASKCLQIIDFLSENYRCKIESYVFTEMDPDTNTKLLK